MQQRCLVWGVFLFTACATTAWNGLAANGSEQDASGQPLQALNRKALAHLRAKEFESAKDSLLEALVLAKEMGQEASGELARVYVYLAYLYIAGEKSRDKSVKQWVLALQIDPSLTSPAELDTPAMHSAYLFARRQLGLASTSETTVPPVPVALSANPPAATHAPAAPATEGAPAIVARHGRGGQRIYVRSVDPDLPAKIPAPLYCPLPFEIPPAQDLVIRCVTQKQQKKSTARLHYRLEGAASEDYSAVELNRSPKGWLHATLSGDLIKGKSLSYYIEAYVPAQAGGEVQVLHLAGPEAPAAFMIREGADAAMVSQDENILATLNTTIADEDDTARYHRRGPGSIWLALAGGSGAAYHGTETVDSGDTSGNRAIRSVGGFTKAGMVQAELEIGYQFTKRFSLSLLARYQYAPSDSSGYTGGKRILTSALAGYVRGRYAWLTTGNFQALASAGLGGGKNFLVVVDKECDANNPPAGCRLTHSDTLHGGPFGVLVGVGGSYHLSRAFAVFLDVNEIATFGKFMALTEVSLGIALAFSTGRPSVPASDEGFAPDRYSEPVGEGGSPGDADAPGGKP